jgi:3-oxoacyl-[acyl-carrier-protein] synthase II
MEMRAIRSVLGDRVVPTYSLNVAIGHSRGTAVLGDRIVANQSLTEKVVPPTVNLLELDDEARGWVSSQPVPCAGDIALSSNSGFGGINCAIVLKRPEGQQPIQ